MKGETFWNYRIMDTRRRLKRFQKIQRGRMKPRASS